MGKILIVIGLLTAVAGLMMLFADKLPWLERLPGDIRVQGRGWSFYFPIVTCIIISIVLSILMNVFFRK